MTETRTLAGDYRGKSCVVFCGASLVGRTIARALAGRGANLCLLDLEGYGQEELEKAESESENQVRIIRQSIISGDEDGIERALSRASEELGGLDYLLCSYYLENDAALHDQDDSSLDDWDRLLRDWVHNTYLVSRAAFPHLAGGEGGRLVFFNTTAGYTGETEGEGVVTASGSLHQCACSSALTGMMTSIARDSIPLGVSVNGVALGPDYADQMDEVVWATDLWLSGICEYACGQILRLY